MQARAPDTSALSVSWPNSPPDGLFPLTSCLFLHQGRKTMGHVCLFVFGPELESLHFVMTPTKFGGWPNQNLFLGYLPGSANYGYSGYRVILHTHMWPPCTSNFFIAEVLEMVDIQDIIPRVFLPC